MRSIFIFKSIILHYCLIVYVKTTSALVNLLLEMFFHGVTLVKIRSNKFVFSRRSGFVYIYPFGRNRFVPTKAAFDALAPYEASFFIARYPKLLQPVRIPSEVVYNACQRLTAISTVKLGDLLKNFPEWLLDLFGARSYFSIESRMSILVELVYCHGDLTRFNLMSDGTNLLTIDQDDNCKYTRCYDYLCYIYTEHLIKSDEWTLDYAIERLVGCNRSFDLDNSVAILGGLAGKWVGEVERALFTIKFVYSILLNNPILSKKLIGVDDAF